MSEEITDSIVDFVNALESACVNLKRQITKDTKEKSSWNPNAIKWSEAEGQNGKYERSEDTDNPQFKAMLKDLADHNGKLNREGYFYWTFKNGSTVGRKKREVKS